MCDYIVTVLTPTHTAGSDVNYTIPLHTLEQHYDDPMHADLHLSEFTQEDKGKDKCDGADTCDVNVLGDYDEYEIVHTTQVLDHVPPPNSATPTKLYKLLYTVARAFYLPGVSEVLVPKKLYVVLRKKEGRMRGRSEVIDQSNQYSHSI